MDCISLTQRIQQLTNVQYAWELGKCLKLCYELYCLVRNMDIESVPWSNVTQRAF